MLVTSENVKLAFKGLRTIFTQRLAQAAVVQRWTEFATRMESSGDEEDYDFLLAIGGLQELLGEIAVDNLRAAGLTIKNKDFHKTIGVPVRTIRHDKLSLLTPAVQLMAIRANQHPLRLATQLLGEGFDTKDYCGSNFFATDKVEYKGAAKFTNLVTTALTQASYEAARAKLRAMNDDKGESLFLGEELVMVVPPELESQANKILLTENYPMAVTTGAENVITGISGGGTNVNKGTAKPIVLPGLSAYSKTAWYLLDTSLPIKPLIVQFDYEPIQNQVTNPEDSYVVTHQAFIYQILAGMGAGYAAPRLIIGSTGVTS